MHRMLLWFFSLVGLVSIAKAEWIEMPWAELNATLPIWKPDDFDESKSYPAIVYYPGTSGEPSATFIHKVTGGKDYVLVGMAYRNSGAYQYTPEEISDSLGLLNAIKQTLVKSLSVDPGRIYVGGISKGGWHSAMLLDRDRSLAGGMIFAAGVFEKSSSSPKFPGALPVFIGCGRYDGNYPQALGALVYFRGLGADTTLSTWADTGHEYPKHEPEMLRQWLRTEAAPSGLADEAKVWMENQLTALEGIENPVEAWLAWEEFASMPFVKKFGAEEAGLAKVKIEEILKNPKVATESKWRSESRRILASESRDRLLNTLTAASVAHEALAKKAAGTIAGADAIRDFERTQELLKTAKVVTRPGNTEPETITPEVTPTAPSGNVDRGGFFPPGIKVKPAE
ncbi:MAG: hypothetical protein ACSHX9_05820 [Luteolibacter sp.]